MLRKDVERSGLAATADPAEIARFNLLAEEWWKPDGSFKLVHGFNAARVRYLAGRLHALACPDAPAEMPLRGAKVLDVGCAVGLVAEPLSLLGADVLGIDAAERNIRIAQQHAEKSGARVRYRHALPEQLSEYAGAFDIVLSLEVVEHVADRDRFLEAIADLVAPGGMLVIGTINRTVRSFAKAIVGAEYLLRWMPRGTHNWRKFVSPGELDTVLKKQRFTAVERAGIVLNPLNMRWSITGDCSVTYLQFHRKHDPAVAVLERPSYQTVTISIELSFIDDLGGIETH